LWVLDVTPLRQMTSEVLAADASLLKPNTAIRWRSEPARGGTNRRFVGSNPPSGAQIYFILNKPAEKVALKVLDVEGRTLRELRPVSTQEGGASNGTGLNRAVWDLTRTPERQAGQPGAGPGGPGGGGFRGFGGFGGTPVPPGTYRVVLTVDGKEYSQAIRVEADPTVPPSDVIAEDEIEEDEEHEREDPEWHFDPLVLKP
jgi:hypothetical protein